LVLAEAEGGGDFAQGGATWVGAVAAQQLVDVGQTQVGALCESDWSELALGEVLLEALAEFRTRRRGAAASHARILPHLLRNRALNGLI
jgi:hypothetical protein